MESIVLQRPMDSRLEHVSTLCNDDVVGEFVSTLCNDDVVGAFVSALSIDLIPNGSS